MTAQAHPLSWPPGFQRHEHWERSAARFRRQDIDGYKERLSIAESLARLRTQIDRLKAEDLIISSDMPVRNDGMPYSGRQQPDDVGVAVYFNLDGQPHCLPCDKWNRLADNIAAVAAHIDTLRAQERYGVGDLRHAFAGYKQLPPPDGYEPEEQKVDWRGILDIEYPEVSTNLVASIYRAEAARANAAGDQKRLRDLNVARDAALKELGA